MSAIPTVDPTRPLRLVEHILAATTLPLPLASVPSMLPPQDTVVPVAELLDGGQPSSQPQAESPVLHTLAIPTEAIADVAVINSVSAAVDAVRASLQDAAGTHAADRVANDVEAQDGSPPDVALHVTLAAPSDGLLVAPIIMSTASPNIAASHASSEVAVTAASPDPHSEPSNPATAVATDQAPLVAVIAPPSSPVLAAVDHALGTTGQTVEGLTASVSDAVSDVVHTVGSLADDALGAVVVTPLHGIGVDALSGLLPVSQPQTPSHDGAAASEVHAILDVIGIPDVLHAEPDQPHATHAPQHLVGSGLI